MAMSANAGYATAHMWNATTFTAELGEGQSPTERVVTFFYVENTTKGGWVYIKIQSFVSSYGPIVNDVGKSARGLRVRKPMTHSAAFLGFLIFR